MTINRKNSTVDRERSKPKYHQALTNGQSFPCHNFTKHSNQIPSWCKLQNFFLNFFKRNHLRDEIFRITKIFDFVITCFSQIPRNLTEIFVSKRQKNATFKFVLCIWVTSGMPTCFRNRTTSSGCGRNHLLCFQYCPVLCWSYVTVSTEFSIWSTIQHPNAKVTISFAELDINRVSQAMLNLHNARRVWWCQTWHERSGKKCRWLGKQLECHWLWPAWSICI